jgi:hypothetical protein
LEETDRESDIYVHFRQDLGKIFDSCAFFRQKYPDSGQIENSIYIIFSRPPEPSKQGVDRTPGNNFESPYLLQELVERFRRRLDPSSQGAAREFIEGWQVYSREAENAFIPWVNLWPSWIANHQEQAVLLGITPHSLDHSPHAEVACFVLCEICDREEKIEEQERQEGKEEAKEPGRHYI